MSEGTLFFYNAAKAGTVLKAIKLGKVDGATSKVGDGEFRDTYPLAGADIAYTIDDHVFTGGHAITRYIGVKAGLYPTDAKEGLIADEILDLIRTTKSAVHGGRGGYEGTLKSIESLLGNSGFAIGSKLSIIDLELATLISWIGTRDKAVESKIAGFENLKKSVAAGSA